MIQIVLHIRVFNYSKNQSIFGWPSRPRMDINGSTNGPGLCSKVQWRSWDKWHGEYLRILRFWTFQASQGKEFYWKLDIPEDLKYIFIFAQWVWGPKLVLYRWVLLKLHYLIMNLHYFLVIFWRFNTQCIDVFWKLLIRARYGSVGRCDYKWDSI